MDDLDPATLFPCPVTVVLGRLPERELPITPEESEAVARALPKRRRDFAAGRSCAHAALQQLGVPVASLRGLDDGRPDWPEGVIGTVTHSTRWCAAAVARSTAALGIGLDIEEHDRLSDGAARQVLSAAELARCDTHRLESNIARTLCFSVKESIYKCLYPLLRRYIDFAEAEIDFDAAPATFRIALAAQLRAELPPAVTLVGRFHVASGSVVTAVTLCAGR